MNISLCPPSQFHLASTPEQLGFKCLAQGHVDSVEGGPSMSTSLPALRFNSFPGDLNLWLSIFKSIPQTIAVTLEKAEVGFENNI